MMTIAKKEILLENGKPVGVTWLWGDGERSTIMLDELNGMDDWFKVHGVSQKFGDAYSGIKTPGDARVMFNALKEQVLGNKTWVKKGGGGTGGALDILAEALIRVMEDNPAVQEVPEKVDILAKLQDMSKAEIKEMKGKWKSIDLEIAKIKLEREEAKLDGKQDAAVDEDLSELFG